MPKILTITRFGNPILRQKAGRLTNDEIQSGEVQVLIENMYHTLKERSYGVGLAAPQVGVSKTLSVIGVKPTPNRPNLEVFDTVLINPEIIECYGEPVAMWEACVSCGSGDGILYAKVPRFEKIRLRWIDEHAKAREEILDGFVAHVAQHEVDHLQGVLFVDRVTESSSYMMADEYRKRIIVRTK